VQQWQMYLFVQDSSDLFVGFDGEWGTQGLPLDASGRYGTLALPVWQASTRPDYLVRNKITLGSLHYPAHRINGTSSQ